MRTAKLFTKVGSQAVRLPKEFRSDTLTDGAPAALAGDSATASDHAPEPGRLEILARIRRACSD